MLTFTTTAEILVRSLANLSWSISGITHELLIHVGRRRAKADSLTIFCDNQKKLTSVFHASVLFLTLNFVTILDRCMKN